MWSLIEIELPDTDDRERDFQIVQQAVRERDRVLVYVEVGYLAVEIMIEESNRVFALREAVRSQGADDPRLSGLRGID